MKSISDILSKEYLGVVLGSHVIHVFRKDGIGALCKTHLSSNPRFIRPPQYVTEVTTGWICRKCVDALWKEQE